MKHHYFSVIKFPVLVSLSLIILVLAFAGIGWQSYRQLGLSRLEAIIFASVFVILLLLIIFWVINLMSTHRRIRPLWLRNIAHWMLIHWYFNFARALNWISFGKRENLMESFLNFHNEIILTNHQGSHHNKILLLLPHCLQKEDCKIRITNDIISCEQCGGCDIAKLKDLAQDARVIAAVASGGSLARKLIKDKHPDVIIAVACHRDLVEGVRDAWRFPVYAILNERPNGPCFETTVSIASVQFALKKFT
jgi:hypothetical protein